MRAIFGLVGILIFVGVMIFVLAYGILPYNKTVIHEGNKAKAQASQIAGFDPQGRRVLDTITLVTERSNGKPKDILVTNLLPGNVFQTFYGLQKNDAIVEIGVHGSLQKVNEIDDPELAKAWVVEAYQTQQPLVIVRDGERITLPVAPAPANAAQPAGQQVAGNPAPANEKPVDPDNPLQKQMDALKSIGVK